MAVDMFLKIEGIDGESKDKAHKDEIDVLSWSWGASQSGTMHAGGGGGTGKANVQDISLTKYLDKSSANLFKNVCNGRHIPEATLTIRKAGASALEYLVITMEDLLITSYQTGGSGHEEQITENITLNFAKVAMKYTPQRSDGAAEGAVEAGWNMEENVEW